MTLQAAIDALRSDAALWDQIGGATSSAGTAAGLLGLTETTMSFAADRTGLLGTYNALTTRLAGLLDDGGDVQHQLSITLDQVAAAYEANDERAAARFQGVWEVK
jgi:hypothetical protein